MTEVEEVYENKRWFGPLGWQSPGLLDRPCWSDCSGTPVQLEQPPSDMEPAGWEVVVDYTTDREGWQYASVFRHLEMPREGGRASQRTGDFVKRRKWRRRPGRAPAVAIQLRESQADKAGLASSGQSSPGHREGGVRGALADARDAASLAAEVAGSLLSPAMQFQGHRMRKMAEADRRKSVLKIFMNMFTSTIKRRQLWQILPWDPGAWMVLYREHGQQIEQFAAGQAARPLQPHTSILPRQSSEYFDTDSADDAGPSHPAASQSWIDVQPGSPQPVYPSQHPPHPQQTNQQQLGPNQPVHRPQQRSLSQKLLLQRAPPKRKAGEEPAAPDEPPLHATHPVDDGWLAVAPLPKIRSPKKDSHPTISTPPPTTEPSPNQPPDAGMELLASEEAGGDGIAAGPSSGAEPEEGAADEEGEGAERGSAGGGDERGLPDPQLIRDLLCAAIHSRAAYGYAMQAGHMASLMSFALLQTVQQLNFDAAGGASGEANNRAVAALTGIREDDIIQADWNNSIMRPCHYVAVDRANRCIVLAIRGSLEVGDILSDIIASPMEVALAGCEGRVHEGMMAAATYVHCNTASALQATARDFPGWPLVLTGHSLGGGVAALLGMLLHDSGTPPGLGPVRCIGIGPAAVMSGELARACAHYTTSLIIRADIIPRLSYASVEGLLLELVAASPMRRAAEDLRQRVTQTIEGLKVELSMALKPPQLVRLIAAPDPKPPGLGRVPSIADAADWGATSAAARVAASAAQLCGGGPLGLEGITGDAVLGCSDEEEPEDGGARVGVSEAGPAAREPSDGATGGSPETRGVLGSAVGRGFGELARAGGDAPRNGVLAQGLADWSRNIQSGLRRARAGRGDAAKSAGQAVGGSAGSSSSVQQGPAGPAGGGVVVASEFLAEAASQSTFPAAPSWRGRPSSPSVLDHFPCEPPTIASTPEPAAGVPLTKAPSVQLPPERPVVPEAPEQQQQQGGEAASPQHVGVAPSGQVQSEAAVHEALERDILQLQPSLTGGGHPDPLYPPGRIIWAFPSDDSDLETCQDEAEPEDAQGASAEPPEVAAANALAEEDAQWLRERVTGRGGAAQGSGGAAGGAAASASVSASLSASASASPRARKLGVADAARGHSAILRADAVRQADEAALLQEQQRPAAAAARQQVLLSEGEHTAFARLLMHPNMLQDHMPDTYLRLLNQL